MDASVRDLERTAYGIRRDILLMTHAAQSGHPGGSMSAIDALVCLYMRVLRLDPADRGWEDRDRFVLSKGHASPALYGILSRMGFLPREELLTFRKFGSRLQGHPENRMLPGVEIATGSLGQGLSVAHGMALGLRLRKSPARVYCMVGDGELQEGQIWEAIMSAGHHRTDNLCVILDQNGLQIDGTTDEIKGAGPPAPKFEAFGWRAIPVDGHDFEALLGAFEEARATRGRPSCIVARTVKGKGVSFMENSLDFHGRACTDRELEGALREIDDRLAALGGEP